MASIPKVKNERWDVAWRGFAPGSWQTRVNVREFIQRNYTPYEGDGTFLAGATERTKGMWKTLQPLLAEERKKGILDVSQVPSSILAHAPGYIDKKNEIIVGLQTDAPLKRALQAQFEARTVTRVYAARVEGVVRDQEGTLTDRLVEDRALRVRTARGRAGQEAITRYRVVERHRDATLLELTLVTGRRGQIRAQLAAWGHPIVGDRSYGSRRDPLGRVCLHATTLAFIHPDGRRVSFESPPPPGFRRG